MSLLLPESWAIKVDSLKLILLLLSFKCTRQKKTFDSYNS